MITFAQDNSAVDLRRLMNSKDEFMFNFVLIL